MRVKDRAVVITGAGGLGSGRAIAIGFASEGARVVVSDVQDEGGRETIRLIERNGGQGVFRHTDVRIDRRGQKPHPFRRRDVRPHRSPCE